MTGTVLSAELEAAGRLAMSSTRRGLDHSKSFLSEWFVMDGTTANRQLQMDLAEDRASPSLLATGSRLFRSGELFSGSPGLPTSQHEVVQDASPSSPSEHKPGGEACALIPRFIVFQTVVVVWILLETRFYMISGGDESGGMHKLFTSLMLTYRRDCIEDSHEVWRWVTYQALHASAWHLITNVLVLVIAGVPLERFYGTWRLAVMWNIGVIGGALCLFVADPHMDVVGMSGGCYALQAIHVAKLSMNWQIEDFRIEKLVFILIVTTAHILHARFTGNSSTSHVSHFGGAVTGLLVGILLGRNHLGWKAACRIKAVTFFIACCLLSFCLWWWARPGAPMEIWEQEPWCWARQVSNATLFGDAGYRCVRCSDDACIQQWEAQNAILRVNSRVCHAVGWAATGR